MKNKKMQAMKPLLIKTYGQEFANQVLNISNQYLLQFIKENQNDVKAVKKHTETEIYPCLSLYQALQDLGIEQSKALTFLDESWSNLAQKGAKQMSSILRLMNLYRLYPRMFKKVAQNQYGEAAHFKAKFYDCGKKRCKFDMTQCLYFDVCQKYHCPELTICFCHTDDVNNENLHPQLVWNRSETIGAGGTKCDFDIYIKEE